MAKPALRGPVVRFKQRTRAQAWKAIERRVRAVEREAAKRKN